jgi:hypothetical protein
MQCYELNVWGWRRLPNNCVRPRTSSGPPQTETNKRTEKSNGNTDPSCQVGGTPDTQARCDAVRWLFPNKD